MTFKFELHRGSELHIRARKQKQYFLGALIIVCILFAIGSYNDPAFLQSWAEAIALVWCLCLPLVFNGAVCEAIAENISNEQAVLDNKKPACDNAAHLPKTDRSTTENDNTRETSNAEKGASRAYSSWYYASLISAIVIPALGAIILTVLTEQPAFLIAILVGSYFPLRNHKLYRQAI